MKFAIKLKLLFIFSFASVYDFMYADLAYHLIVRFNALKVSENTRWKVMTVQQYDTHTHNHARNRFQ